MSDSDKQLNGGFLIIFDGIDGVGKTTQLKLAQQKLEAAGWPVSATRNLGGSPIGEALREVLLQPIERPPATDLYVSVAIQEALIPALAAERQAGKLVLMDRGPLSLAAYQIYGSGVDEANGWSYVAKGMSALRPDLVITYQCDTKTAVERARKHSQHADYFESKSLEYFERVAHGFQVAAEHYPIQVINADQSIEAVQAETWRIIEHALQLNNASHTTR